MSGWRLLDCSHEGWSLRGEPPQTRTARQVDVLAAFVAAGGSVSGAAARVGIRPSTAKRHLADLRAANQRVPTADSARLLIPFSIRRSLAKSPISIAH